MNIAVIVGNLAGGDIITVQIMFPAARVGFVMGSQTFGVIICFVSSATPDRSFHRREDK